VILKTITLTCLLLLTACESTYYDAMEQIGIHKRDITRLIDAMQDAINESNAFIEQMR
jgi:hypothetical protein